ncbi:class A beta-lactamase-related serine hydrolase (plasmid) [Sphingobium sp. V4]|uniref:class A beta-lactamase-related serine hydrolase n=1 Tax=Sphingobium sp. V4 TaxID=3038927 RepID=UPI002557DC16|nr:class A beta-lactamase-related serine hydrolase [Sphingobium sp. V4]WIW90561.1 class A beta-lactamase-related serine hydrolase [Sphingobium sp. V4]
MRARHLSQGAGLLAAAMWLTPSPAQPVAPAAPDLSPLGDRVEAWVAEGIYPGAGLIVGQADNVLLERYFGVYRADTRVHVASAGKWLAAATIAALVDEGKLRWDDPAGKWIAELTGPMARATLRQLLSHTAGYPDYQPPSRPRDHYATLAESVAHIAPLAPDADPGTRFRYGGLAMQVAGRMAERATGQTWDRLFQTRIARPLGMIATGFAPVPDEPGFSPMLGGSAHTTLRDYARFLQMIAGGGMWHGRRLLSSDAIEEMERDQLGSAMLMPGEYVDQARASSFSGVYGLGQWREEIDGAGRATLLSSPGWAGAYPWVDRRSGIWGFILAKVDTEKAKALGFSSFLAGSVLPVLARDALADNARGWQHGYAPIAGGRLYWEASGDGPPLILLHGHSLDRTMWDPQMAALSQHFRVIRYDLRGYGRSTMPQEGENRLHADDLRLLMDNLGIARAHVVGLSLGGTVALDMLALHPERLLSVMAASGDLFDFYPAPDDPLTPTAVASRRAEIAALRAGGIHAFKRRWLDDLTRRGGGCVGAIRPGLWAQIAKWTAWQPLHLEPRLLLGRALVDRLRARAWPVPVQILTGDADRGRRNGLVTAFPTVPQVIIPNSGHMMNMENPLGFNAAVLRFTMTGGTGKIDDVTPCTDVGQSTGAP